MNIFELQMQQNLALNSKLCYFDSVVLFILNLTKFQDFYIRAISCISIFYTLSSRVL